MAKRASLNFWLIAALLEEFLTHQVDWNLEATERPSLSLPCEEWLANASNFIRSHTAELRQANAPERMCVRNPKPLPMGKGKGANRVGKGKGKGRAGKGCVMRDCWGTGAVSHDM